MFPGDRSLAAEFYRRASLKFFGDALAAERLLRRSRQWEDHGRRTYAPGEESLLEEPSGRKLDLENPIGKVR